MTLVDWMEQYVEQNGLDDLEGVVGTAIEGVWFYRSSKGNKRQPLVYQSGVIILGQGTKHIYLGDKPVKYGGDDYLVVGVPLPLECEAIADAGKPLMGLTVDVDPQVLHRLVNKLEELNVQPKAMTPARSEGLSSVSMDDDMVDVSCRIMKALCHPVESALLGESLTEELALRALLSSEGHVLFDLAKHEGHYARVAKALEYVHHHYHDSLTVQGLAETANMSISAFHQAFRSVTLETPIQYIKKVRLNKAKELIHLDGLKVSEAARRVGYNSTSQFSREYKRHFNETPRAGALAA